MEPGRDDHSPQTVFLSAVPLFSAKVQPFSRGWRKFKNNRNSVCWAAFVYYQLCYYLLPELSISQLQVLSRGHLSFWSCGTLCSQGLGGTASIAGDIEIGMASRGQLHRAPSELENTKPPLLDGQ